MEALNGWLMFTCCWIANTTLFIVGISNYYHKQEIKEAAQIEINHQKELNESCGDYCDTSIILFCKETSEKKLLVVGCADNNEPAGIKLDLILNED